MLICFVLLVHGNGSFSILNAQTPVSRASAKQIIPRTKGSAEIKNASIKNLAAKRKANANQLGDPCLETAPITVGQTINGNLTATDCVLDDTTLIDFYSFNGNSGQAIWISNMSGEFDSFLYLLDADGNIIDANDDSGDGLDSRIPAEGGVITLPYTGEFIIGVNEYDPAPGAYTLTLNTDAACAPQTIAYNQTVSGTLTSSDCAVNLGGEPFYTDLYQFNGVAGQQISILQSSAAVNSYLILHTPSGDGSDEDDNSGGGNDARIPATGTITLAETGTYVIEASTFNSFEVGAYTIIVNGPSVVAPSATDFDYEGDGKADVSVFRSGNWYVSNSSNNAFSATSFGTATDTITPADYDGDGKTDYAVFRNGNWYILNSNGGTFSAVAFGSAGDIPVPADYDGDGKADVNVFRASTGSWYRLNSSNGQFVSTTFGTSGDKPLVGDFDGDNKADVAVFRPSSGSWFILNSSNGQFVAVTFGNSTDAVVPADYDGDGKTDIAVFRNGDWYRLNSSNGQFAAVSFGSAGDLAVPADYDGDGKADVAVFRPSTGSWYELRSTQGFAAQTFGTSGDIPTPNAYVR